MIRIIPSDRDRTGGVRHIASIAVLAFAILHQGEARAQEGSVRPGDRVRVTAPSLTAEPIIGVVSVLDGETLSLAPTEGQTGRELPLDAVTKLELSTERRSQTGKGALIGGSIGLVTGALAGAVVGAGCEDEIACPGVGGGAAVVGGLGLALGAGVGAIIGSNRKKDVWQVVPIERTRVGLSIDWRGAAAGISVRLTPTLSASR